MQCPHCKLGKIIYDNNDLLCNHCGVLLEKEISDSQPFHTKIIRAETDTPDRETHFKDKDTHKHFQEVPVGNKTEVRKIKDMQLFQEQVERLTNYNKLKITRLLQHARIDIAIDNMCEQLGLNPEKVLNRFEFRLKKIKVNDILRSDNIIANRGQLRSPAVVGAGFIWKVYQNKVTFRCLHKLAKCGNKSLQKIIKIIG